MLKRVMRAKIHRATVTEADLDYVGSITIDQDLLDAVGILPNEAVVIADIDNGERLETYVFAGERGSGVIGINGAAARMVEVGHKVIIIAYGYGTDAELESHEAKVIVVDEDNRIDKRLSYPCHLPAPAIV